MDCIAEAVGGSYAEQSHRLALDPEHSIGGWQPMAQKKKHLPAPGGIPGIIFQPGDTATLCGRIANYGDGGVWSPFHDSGTDLCGSCEKIDNNR